MKKTLLAKSEVEKISRQCKSTLNWTDGGHWMGRGPEPNCSRGASLSSTMTLVIKFPTDKAAFKWNAEQEKGIRMAGHAVGVGVGAAVALLTSGWAGFAVSSIANIFQGEIQARVPYPKVARGWSYKLVFVNTYTQNTAYLNNLFKFMQTVNGTVKDQNGNIQLSSSTKSEHTSDTLPDSVARRLASAKSFKNVIIYK